MNGSDQAQGRKKTARGEGNGGGMHCKESRLTGEKKEETYPASEKKRSRGRPGREKDNPLIAENSPPPREWQKDKERGEKTDFKERGRAKGGGGWSSARKGRYSLDNKKKGLESV